MTNTNLIRIRTIGKRGRERQPPDGMEVRLTNPGIAPLVNVQIRLPGKTNWTDLGLRRIENEVVELPLPLAFLCHAEEDEAAIAAIGASLEADGIATWFSPRLAGGANWKAEIDAAIRAADFVVVFLSKRSVSKKGYFQREVKRAFELLDELPDGERFIIPVLLEECAPPERFADIPWLKLYEPDGYEHLKQSLKDLGVPT